MSPALRRRVFLIAAAAAGALLLWGLTGLPDYGVYNGPYGDVLNRVAVAERSATNVVAAVTFDYRGVDTMGEEYILFAAVLGVAILLRAQRDEHEEPPDEDAADRHAPATSNAVRVVGLGLVGPVVLFGVYLVAHGHLTPGGGFQGGVVLATAALLVYLSGEYVTLRRVSPELVTDAAEAVGAAGYVAMGLLGVAGVGLPGQRPAPRAAGPAAVGGHDPAHQRRRRPGGGRRLRPAAVGVPGADPGHPPARGGHLMLRFLPYMVAAWLLLVGLYGIVTSRNLVHAIICLSVAQSSTYILLLSVGFERGGTAPIFLDVPVGTRAVDPVVGALTLTDIVVGATVSALLLALAVQAHKHHGTLDPEQFGREQD